VAEPIVGATLAAAEPPEGYWDAIVGVLRRHGVLLIADEVMTGFGRTGRWFGGDHWDLRPDILIAAKGATSGYWPFGFVAAAGHVAQALEAPGSFIHGFTYSHHPVGAAVAGEVLRILEDEQLVHASEVKGAGLRAALEMRLADHPHVGQVRGRGLLVGIELVADRERRLPFPRSARVTERVVAAARDAGVLVYSGTGNANGLDGDQILLGPPFVITDAELDRVVEVVTAAIGSVSAG
jgi:adenosylmethionine-8-amino-7-oxononanoate aminotransferase